MIVKITKKFVNIAEVYSRKDTNKISGYEIYTIKDFLSKKEEIIKLYKNDNSYDIKYLKIAFSILNKVFDENKKIIIEWG